MKNELKKPVRLAAIGLGNRTRKYLSFVEAHPEMGRVSAIVEPDADRLESVRLRYGLDAKDCFATAEEFFSEPRDVDAVIIGSPDATHYPIAKASIAQGYHCLLEKPVAETPEQCIELTRMAEEKGVVVCVCYVLRYHPFYEKLKEIVDSQKYGPVISVSHTENVGVDRMTHCYVRGIFSSTEKSSPMFLSKCCHDVDALLWITGKHVAKISSFGNLCWFKESNAPEGSARRCVDCSVEADCPFSAVDLYRRRRAWTDNFLVPEGDTLEAVVDRELAGGPYGRCVYRCDNNVVDHQTVSMEMTDGTCMGISMDAFNLRDIRTTKIEFAFGELYAAETSITLTDFRTRQEEVLDFSHLASIPFHANADLKIVEDFLLAVADPENRKVRSSISDVLESHLVCFQAEDSRTSGRTLAL